ncbi:MAG: response regulator transcription factor [Planctomycetota bacterium]
MNDRPVIMVVEDDKEMNELECELLEIHGMEPVPAYDGAEAVEVSKHCKADAVLMDIMLPEMDGLECCRQLRARNGGRVPIIIISALDTDDSRQQGVDVGADAYFTKPFDPDQIIEAIRDLIDRSRIPDTDSHPSGGAGGRNI